MKLLLALAFTLPFTAWSPDVLVKGDEFEAFDAASLNAFDFDGDGRKEIVSFNDNGNLYVLDSRGGRVLAELGTRHPPGWAARDINPVAIGDLYADGTPCIVAANSAAYVSAWCYEGRRLLGGMRFEKRFETQVDLSGGQQVGMDGGAFLADVDGKPGLEIFVETDGHAGQFSLDNAGKVRWSHAWFDGNAGAEVADLDGNGRKEAVFATDAGVIAVFDADKGTPRWQFDARKNGADPGSIPVRPTIVDLDGDGKLEMVFGARNAVDDGPGWQERAHAVFFALRHDGSVLWRVSYDWMNPLTYTRPAPHDVDGDGSLDVVAMDWNTVGHRPGDWETTKRGPNLFALDGRDGSVLWRRGIPSYWSNKDIALADVHKSPGMEIVANMESEGRDGIGIFEAATGKGLAWHDVADAPFEVMRGPVAEDLDGDGDADIIVPVARNVADTSPRGLDVGVREGRLIVLDSRHDGAIAWSGTSLHTDAPMAQGGSASWLTGWRGLVTASVVVLIVVTALLIARRRPVR